MLLNIKGIGPEFAAVLYTEGLFRHFDNRRQVAAYAGLAPTPWQSGSIANKASRKRAIRGFERRWSNSPGYGLRHQPDSGPQPLVPRKSKAQWRSSQEDDNRRARSQAAGRAMEICERRCRHRRGSFEDHLTLLAHQIQQSPRTPIGSGGSWWTKPKQAMAAMPISRMVSSS